MEIKTDINHIIAIDPQIEKCGVAYFSRGENPISKIIKTSDLLVFKKYIPSEEDNFTTPGGIVIRPHLNTNIFGFTCDKVLIEKPYIKIIEKKKTARTYKKQYTINMGIDNLLIKVGQIKQKIESEMHLPTELIPSWGATGWIQSMFSQGRYTASRELSIQGMKNHVRANWPDLVDVTQDEKAALCLGWFWLRTNGYRGFNS